MINNSTTTTVCKCDSPKHCVMVCRTVRSGKNIGKNRYLVRCLNCGAQWWTMSNKYKESYK